MPRGRPKGSKNKNKLNIKSDMKEIILTCKKCLKQKTINTTTPEIYTDEIKENYICIFCK